jgi:serine/threonine protein kinase
MAIDSSLPIGALFGEFQILHPLGEGTFGSVYEAIWKLTNQRVALKVLHRRHLEDRDAVERFFREAEALRLLDHPYVVDVFAYGEQAGVPYIVLEFLDGVALDQRTVQPETLAVGDTLDIMLPVITAVDAFHQAGIVHRDLKPGNIFLVKDANRPMIPKVLDFGLAKMARVESKPGLTLPLVGMGTPNFMSPEQILDARNASPLSDQFSIGVMLYFLLTGQKPFDAPAPLHTIKRVLDGVYTRPSELVPWIPQELEAMIVRAMSAKPADRFPSLRDLGRSLLPFAHTQTRALMARDFSADTSAEVVASSDPGVNLPQSPLGKVSSIRLFESLLDVRRQRDDDDRRSFRSTLSVWAAMLAVSSLFIAMLGREPTAYSRPRPVENTVEARGLTPQTNPRAAHHSEFPASASQAGSLSPVAARDILPIPPTRPSVAPVEIVRTAPDQVARGESTRDNDVRDPHRETIVVPQNNQRSNRSHPVNIPRRGGPRVPFQRDSLGMPNF